jgi:uncharacterized metal-binding protein YceD (DUF177 family)
MTIIFDKINSTAKPVKLSLQDIVLDGTLQKSGYHQVTLDANLAGKLRLSCDRCGKAYDYDMRSTLRLKLSDIISEDKVDLDIIEFLDGKIDLLYILESEINSIKTSYHYCGDCDNDDDFEVEY